MKQRKVVKPQKPYTVVGRISGIVYDRAKTLRGAKAQRRRVAEKQFIPANLLDIMDPMGRVIQESTCS
jgi:hypothetical protein